MQLPMLITKADESMYSPCLKQWLTYRDLAIYKEEKEYNVKTNKKWKKCDKLDSMGIN